MRLFVCLFLAVWLTGCGTVDLYTGAPVPEGGPKQEETALLWFWGLIGDDIEVSVPQGASRVKVYRSFPGWIVAILTAGILQPMHVQVWPVVDSPGTK